MIHTAGIFFISLDNKLLIGKPTGSTIWSIPKGVVDDGETFIDAAIREFKEESGILVSKIVLNELPQIKYKNGKKTLCSFYFKSFLNHTEYNPVCDSLIDGSNLPEIEYFKWVELDEAHLYLHEAQQQIIKYLI